MIVICKLVLRCRANKYKHL